MRFPVNPKRDSCCKRRIVEEARVVHALYAARVVHAGRQWPENGREQTAEGMLVGARLRVGRRGRRGIIYRTRVGNLERKFSREKP
jgi:hypothetical protein